MPVFCIDSGNKSDLVNEREVATSVGEEFARRHRMSFLETSALAASNVDVLFTDIARRLVSEAVRDGLTHGKRSSVDSANLGKSRPINIIPYCGCQTS
jgi:GTPase SAR1 family protein